MIKLLLYSSGIQLVKKGNYEFTVCTLAPGPLLSFSLLLFARFQSVTKAYYRGADGVILMYDITSEESFIAVRKWIISMQVHVQCIQLLYIHVHIHVRTHLNKQYCIHSLFFCYCLFFQENMDQLPTCLLLVGNKVDLEGNFKREVLSETGETFAKVIGLWVRERVGGWGATVVIIIINLLDI